MNIAPILKWILCAYIISIFIVFGVNANDNGYGDYPENANGNSDNTASHHSETGTGTNDIPSCDPTFQFSADILVMNEFIRQCQNVTLPNCDDVESQVNSTGIDYDDWCCSDANCGSGSSQVSQRRMSTTDDPLTVRITSDDPIDAVTDDKAKAICEAMGSLSADQCAVTTIVREENDDGTWTWTTTERDGNGEITSGPLVEIRDSNGNLIEDAEEESSSSSGIDDDLWLILWIILGLLALLLCALVLLQIHKYCERRLECSEREGREEPICEVVVRDSGCCQRDDSDSYRVVIQDVSRREIQSERYCCPTVSHSDYNMPCDLR